MHKAMHFPERSFNELNPIYLSIRPQFRLKVGHDWIRSQLSDRLLGEFKWGFELYAALEELSE